MMLNPLILLGWHRLWLFMIQNFEVCCNAFPVVVGEVLYLMGASEILWKGRDLA